MERIVIDARTGASPFAGRLTTACSLFFILLALGAAAYFSLTLPIYVDEVTWDSFSHRNIMDHYTMILAYPQCGERTFSQKLPWLWVIPAWVNHLLYFRVDHVLGLRVIGTGCFLLWLLLWLLIIRRVFHLRNIQLLAAGAAVLAFFALDHVFLLLLLARPEQAEILETLIALALTIYAPSFIDRPIWILTGTALFIATTLQLGFTNPREIVLLPFFALAAFQFARITFRFPSGSYLFSAMVCGILLYSYSLWLGRFACPDSDIVRSFWSRETFPFHLLWENPSGFFSQALARFRDALRQDMAASNVNYWLGTDTHENIFIFTAALFPRLALLGLAVLYICRRFLMDGISRRMSGNYLVLAQPVTLAFALLLALFALLAFQGQTHSFYSGALNVPLLLMACVLTFSHHKPAWAWQRYASVVFFALLLCGTVNLLHLLLLYPHPERYENIIPNRVISFSVKDLDERAAALPVLTQTCHINGSARHLVLDILTYFPFRQSFQPYDVYFTTGQMADFNKTAMHFDMARFIQFLDKNQSGGVIADCRDFPDAMRPYATERQGFCCISPEAIHRVAAGAQQ